MNGSITRNVVVAYTLQKDGETPEQVFVSATARWMCVQYRDGELRLLAMVDPQVPTLKRRVKVISTGGEVSPEFWEYVGSAFHRDLAWHAFLSVDVAE